MKIVLDFDDTIFNTHLLMHTVFAVFKKLDFTEEEFFGAYQECKKRVGDFDPETIIELLNKAKPFDKIKTEKEINLILSDLEDFVYPDFFDFVKDFDKEDLILLSFGTVDFQRIKIENSKIKDFFSEVIITTRDKTKDLKNILMKNKDEKIFFIDDKAEQIDKIKKELPQVITMKVERPQGGHLNTKSKSTDYVVKNLDEAKEIIFNI